MQVELRAARVPYVGHIAHHCWLVVWNDGRPERWEVWQWRNTGGDAWGHLHRNLLRYDSGIGNGPSRVIETWRGAAASPLAERLAQAPQHYPWRQRYLPWPGPNSNTFVRWVIGDPTIMGWQALGKHYPIWRRGPSRTVPPR